MVFSQYIILITFFHSVHCLYNDWQSTKDNYSVFEVTAFNSRERAILYHMHTREDSIIFLNGVTNIVSSPMYVIVSGCCLESFTAELELYGIEFVQVMKESVLKEFKAEMQTLDVSRNSISPSIEQKFLDWKDIKIWVNYQRKRFPSLKKIKLGNTYEGRELFVLEISNGLKKPGIFILGGEQGRDKMSSAVILSFIEKILKTKLYVELTNVYDFYFMPIFNPDGYDYSMKKEWYWNKNRKHFYPIKTCTQFNKDKAIGVNIDRNWFMSNGTYVEGAECDSIFLGHEALTEEEPRELANFLNAIAENLMAFINVRGFGSLLTVPYATENDFANNYAVLSEMLLHASNAAFSKYNVSCNLCSTHNCFYNHTGNAPDWVKKNMNVPVVFTLYLKHFNSFLPQIEQVPTVLMHFSIIIKETLLLAYDIYGPLFNCANNLPIYLSTIVAMIFIVYEK